MPATLSVWLSGERRIQGWKMSRYNEIRVVINHVVRALILIESFLAAKGKSENEQRANPGFILVNKRMGL